jgi:hypothetical protein
VIGEDGDRDRNLIAVQLAGASSGLPMTGEQHGPEFQGTNRFDSAKRMAIFIDHAIV